MPPWQRALLTELLGAYGPGGQEQDVRDVCRRELEPLADEVWVDAAGNLVGLLRGASPARDDGPPVVRVMAHMDELAMMVKRVEPSGDLHVTPFGVMYPGNFGLGPVAVLGDVETLTAVLTLGSEHTTAESARIWETKPDQGDKALDWTHVYVFTGRTPEELAAAGVHPGTRVCVDRSRRVPFDVNHHVGSWFMDDRAAVVAVLSAARALREQGLRPAADTYVVFTTNEEIGGIGASYASASLPGDVTLALDVGPTEAEYATTVDGGPIVAYGDAAVVYDKSIADRLLALGRELDLAPQPAVLGAFESDASQSKVKGQAPRAALIGLPTLSTHGYEVIRHDTIDRCARLLAAYLQHPVG